jgi:hypothetical protein
MTNLCEQQENNKCVFDRKCPGYSDCESFKPRYDRTSVLAELSGETDLTHETIGKVLDAIDRLDIEFEDWRIAWPDVTLSAADCDRCGQSIHDEGMPIKWTALAAKITNHDTKCPAAGGTP